MNQEVLPTTGPQAEKIRSMFAGIASRYDLANQVLSLGIHHRWRRALVRWSGVRQGQSVLDCATGTGDLAIEFKRAVGAAGTVIGTDFCAEMLEPAPAKAERLGLKIQFETADVTNLPYKDATFDVASISFGIRNVERPDLGLKELARVVKPGGVVIVLEFGQPQNRVFRSVYRLYSERVLPRVGGVLTGDSSAYRYLEKSSAHFPSGGDFLKLLQATGLLARCEYRTLSGGIAYIYRGIRI